VPRLDRLGRCWPDKRHTKKKWIIKRNTHEPLIDEETAQKILAQPNPNRRRPKSPRPLSGIIDCAECGEPYYVHTEQIRHFDKAMMGLVAISWQR
jgi:hypothetical protein